MQCELTEQILKLQQGDHLCLFYDRDPAEQMPALVPFIQQGLESDEQFIYIADDFTIEELNARLQQSGVDVAGQSRSGRLRLWSRQQWRQRGKLNSKAQSLQVERLIEEASSAGFKGIRFGIEMTWTLGPDISASQLEHWEATLNTLFTPKFPARMICQYNRSRLSPDTILAALHTHPLAVLGEVVCPNFFYQAPLILDQETKCRSRPPRAGSAARVEWMISQLKRARIAEKEREELIEKRAALAEAERSRRDIEVVLESIVDGFVALDSQGRCTYANEVFTRTWTGMREELLGNNFWQLFPRLATTRLYHEFQKALAGQCPSSFEDFYPETGGWMETRIYPWTNGAAIYFQDATMRRRAEETSRLLAAIVESSNDAILSKDLNGVITGWNQGAQRLFGYVPGEVVGRPVTMLIPRERHSEETRILEQIRRGERVEHYETVRQRKDGGLLAISLTVSPIKDPEGNIIGASSIARDITERKRAEHALQESEGRFRQLAEAMPHVVWAAQPSGKMDYFNQRCSELFGANVHSASEATWRSLFHPDDADRFLNAWHNSLQSGEPCQLECRLRDGGAGSVRWFLARAVPARNEHNQIVRWYGTFTDIDDQKRNEERFVRLNATMVSVLEAIPEVVFVTSRDGRIEFKNPAASKLCRATGWANRLPAPIEAELERVTTTGEDHLPTTFKLVHRFSIDHDERYFLSRIVAMTAADGRVFGAVVMLQDVTEFRLLDEVKTNLISTVSHELNTPVTGLRTALLLVSDQTLGPLNAKQAEMLSIAAKESERLLRTLNALLDLTRFEDNVVGLRLESTTAEDLVRAALEEIRAGAEGAEANVKAEIAPNLPDLRVDKERIVHVLTNFLSNAIKYSPPGCEIIVCARREGPAVYFGVADRGPGVPHEFQSRIFEKFFRVPGAAKKGSGLGLSIAREFVRAHRGRIGLRSEPGQGSEFYFILPIGRRDGQTFPCSACSDGQVE